MTSGESYYYYAGATVASAAGAGIVAFSNAPPAWWVFAIMAAMSAALAAIDLFRVGEKLRSWIGP